MNGARPELDLLRNESLWTVAGAGFRYFDWCAIFLWALSGAILGARRGYDLTGMYAIALVSSCGGGLLRDALFLQAGPPALVRTPTYVVLALAATLITWLVGPRLLTAFPKLVAKITHGADAVGLGAFTVVGMKLALAAKLPLAGAMLVGIVNAVGGGLLRSVLLRRVPEVFRPGELTALAAFAGTLLYCGLARVLHLDERLSALLTIAWVAALRWISVRYRLHTRPAWSFEARRRRLQRSAR